MLDEYIVGPEDGFIFEDNDEEYQKFIATPGAIINTGEEDDEYPTVYENMGLFTINDLEGDSPEQFNGGDTTEFDAGHISGALVKHLFTGQTYATIPGCSLRSVVDFDFKDGLYSNIRLDLLGEKDWTQVSTDFDGTRVGGLTSYNKNLWPHFEDTPLKFLGRYSLPNGKSIHMFFNWESDDCIEIEGGSNCALVDNGPVPPWITLKPLEVDETDFVEFPNYAFTPIAPKSGIRPTPYWVQEEDIPADPNYRFLMQFGYSTIPNYDPSDFEFIDLMVGDGGDWYLFYNSETEEARILAQFS